MTTCTRPPLVEPKTTPLDQPRSKFTGWLVLSRAWISILLLAPAGVAAAFSRPHCPVHTWGHFAFESIGWLLFLAGAGMRWWATLYIGARKGVELIVDGPYSVTRNPLYFGTFLLTLAVGILSQSVVLLAAIGVVSFAYLAVTVGSEEEVLLARHGEAYAAYRRRVPRFFPRFRLFHTPARVEVLVRGLWPEFVRMCRWAWIPILCDLLAHARLESWWPVWFSLP